MTARQLGKPVRVPEQPCPVCAMTLSGASAFGGDAAPKPGDGTVCAYCGTPLVFGLGLVLRQMTPEEVAALPTGEALQLGEAMAIVDAVRRRREH